MLTIAPPNYLFCPFCSHALETVTEENKIRKFCPSCKWVYYPHVFGAAGAVILNGTKILLVKRNREPYKGSWMFPAGYIEFGENPEETIIREVKEETNLDINFPKLLSIHQNPDDPRAPGHFGMFYLIKDIKNEIRTNTKENSNTKWFDISELPLIQWESHKKVVQEIRNILKDK